LRTEQKIISYAERVASRSRPLVSFLDDPIRIVLLTLTGILVDHSPSSSNIPLILLKWLHRRIRILTLSRHGLLKAILNINLIPSYHMLIKLHLIRNNFSLFTPSQTCNHYLS
jgi:hypothetical protein